MKAAAIFAAGILLWRPAVSHAQAAATLSIHPEVRVDAIVRRDTSALEAGAGLQIPAGYYSRIGVIVAAGSQYSAGAATMTGRVDVMARFLLDPFRQQAHGLSLGGGVSLRAREHDHVRPYMLLVADYEGAITTFGAAPAVQLGLGGGVRIGAALRWGGAKTR